TFPDLLAAAFDGRDVEGWAARHNIHAVAR
ncbi:MAG: hypothetical protein QOJ19_4471, partial [Acidimicrobiia bacterium]|nr:hypothetical protein [Acidimicrobiia bacterium]